LTPGASSDASPYRSLRGSFENCCFTRFFRARRDLLPSRFMKSENSLWFAALCLFWGGNWLAVKLAVTELPPIAAGATRALLSGAIMLLLAGPGPVRAMLARAPWRVGAVSLLTTTICFSALYWGAARLSTGVSAIVNNALMPIGLLVFGYAFREETLSRRRIAGIALGALGLALLFARRTQGTFDADAVYGLAAVAGGTLAHCLGSVWCRPLLRMGTPMAVGSLQMILGGLLLVPLSAVLEQPGSAELARLLSPAMLACMAWMVLAGGVAAVAIYLRLIRDWGPARAGMYAFVSPIIATGLGAAFLGERLGPLEIVGALVLLAAAALVLPRRLDEGSTAPDRTPEPRP
jgi:drug/metabolite transporter (DMT)-like permease